MDALKKTPFWYFIYSARNMESEDIKRFKKNDPCISEIIRRSNLHERITPRGFSIGGQLVLPKRMDVELMFGIRDGDWPIEVSNRTVEENEFIVRCFPLKIVHLRSKAKGSYHLTKAVILKALYSKLDAPDNDLTSIHDVARLVHLYLLSNFFLANQNYMINWHITKCVVEIDNLCMYDWSRLILRSLLKGIQNGPTTLTGTCTLFLQVNNFELYSILYDYISSHFQFLHLI